MWINISVQYLSLKKVTVKVHYFQISFSSKFPVVPLWLRLILTCHFQVSRGCLRSPDPIGQLTHVTAGVVRLDGADDEVAAGLDVDPAVHAAHAGDGDVVPVPGHGEVARGALALADEADHVPLGLVLVERRVGDDGSSWKYYL